jgi:ATP-binding cassette, subfamily B, bacterial
MPSTDDLPPALSSMWRALKRGYQAEPLLLSVAFGLALLAAMPDALIALLLKFLADGMLDGKRILVLTAAIGLGTAAAATWFLRIISDRTQRRFRDRVTIALETHVAKLLASTATIEHHDPIISIASPCCATRCLCSTTCTCRSSTPAAGFCDWA